MSEILLIIRNLLTVLDQILSWLNLILSFFLILLLIKPVKEYISNMLKIRIDESSSVMRDIAIGGISGILVIGIFNQAPISNMILFILIILLIRLGYTFTKRNEFRPKNKKCKKCDTRIGILDLYCKNCGKKQ